MGRVVGVHGWVVRGWWEVRGVRGDGVQAVGGV